MKLYRSLVCAVYLLPGVLADDPNPCGKRDPALGPFFHPKNIVPNALNSSFMFEWEAGNRIEVEIGSNPSHIACLNPDTNPDTDMRCVHDEAITTTIYGYGQGGDYTWPGKTFEVNRGVRHEVTWKNNIKPEDPYILTGFDNDSNDAGKFCGVPVVDKSLHWAYSLDFPELLEQPTIDKAGVPIVTHLHGGHSDSASDGNPEFFYSYELKATGPQFETETFTYQNNLEAAPLWYHDHALGLTRLNVYAGLAGFYFVRDPSGDSGKWPNNLNLPVFPYEVALAIQDRMFKNNGELLYPAFPGDPAYDDFITCEGVDLCEDFDPCEGVDLDKEFPYCGNVEDNECEGCEAENCPAKNCGPTALAEFFGDHMVVNGKVWPRMEVEPRSYRLRLLNGCDSRFLVLEFVVVECSSLDPLNCVTDPTGGTPLPFYVIGADQGLKTKGTDAIGPQTELVMAPGERFDVIVNFNDLTNKDKRVIMKNSGGDAPFGGFPVEETSETTDRIMAFDVVLDPGAAIPEDFPEDYSQDDLFNIDDFNAKIFSDFGHQPVYGPVKRIRHVALFEGNDEKGRLQPLLGTAEPATDYRGDPILWPSGYPEPLCGTEETEETCTQVEGTVAWHTEPSTENPKKNDVEIWKIWNLSADGHPIHLHLVDFEVISRHQITFETDRDDDGFCNSDTPTNGVCLGEQPIFQHNGSKGSGRVIKYPATGGCVSPETCFGDPITEAGYNDIGYPKDIVIANPGEVTVIKANFHKAGRYVWHCHILSHEDHEMMRVLHVGPDPTSMARNLRSN